MRCLPSIGIACKGSIFFLINKIFTLILLEVITICTVPFRVQGQLAENQQVNFLCKKYRNNLYYFSKKMYFPQNIIHHTTLLSMTTSTLLHLRVPFSFFLMPIFWFALSVAPSVSVSVAVFAFLSLHLFAYPASNGFNSYYDKDEGSIGGLEKPPPVTKELLWASLFMEGLALFMALFVNWQFAVAIFLYGLASKAYSHDKIRLKKYPVISLLTVGFFQGAFIFLAVYQAVTEQSWQEVLQFKVVLPAALMSFMLIGSYPMTQIYQHEEDAKRGDLTMSRLLGIRGTFAYTATLFGCAIGGLSYYFWQYDGGTTNLLTFHLALSPTLLFFLYWAFISYQNPQHANFKNTMWLNLISALCTNFCFILFFYWKHFAIN